MNREAPVRITHCQPFRVAATNVGATLGRATGCPGGDFVGALACGYAGSKVDEAVRAPVVEALKKNDNWLTNVVNSLVDVSSCESGQ